MEAGAPLALPRREILIGTMFPTPVGRFFVSPPPARPAVMLLEAFLIFLGLGVQPPMSSWGVLIKEGAEVMEEFPWLLIFPGLVLAATLFSLNFLGDGLRDALDPRASKE